MRLPSTQLALLAAAAVVSGCGGGGGGGSSGGIGGVWQRVDGDLFYAQDLEELRYLDFSGDGRGVLYGAQPTTNVRECAGFLYAASKNGTLSFDAPDLGDGDGGNSQILLWDRDGGTLTLSDATGATSTFERASEVPAEETCTVAELETMPLAYGFPGYGGNLASDGTYLWYQGNDDLLVAIDPATGTTAMTIASSPGFPLAFEPNGDMWTKCNCGGDDFVHRWELPSTQVDSVPIADLNDGSFSMESAGVDAGALWVSGYDYGSGTSVLHQVDAASEPDVLVATLTGPLDGRQLTFLDGERWVIAYGLTPKLARVGTDGRAVESVALPRNLYPYGMAGHDGALYLTAYDVAETPVLMRVVLP